AAASHIVGDASLSNASAVFVGRWGDTTAALDANAVRGKVAVFTYSPPRGGRGGAAGGGGGGRGGFGAMRDPRAAAGGAALILVASPDSAPRGIVTSAFASRPGMRPDPAVTGTPAAAISASLAEKIFGRPLNQLSAGATGGAVSANWSNVFTP